ncbi:molecular chaperone [Vibrio tetraodonis]|uniref:fimbrial biogenesis chaperone n=1 Tax=Vibrio tetraodonis TaxID=2231647 RepID=UPI000E0B5E79|nr:molecular chaperone [Vibrio tetraodonis]
MKNCILAIVCCLMVSTTANAALALDRTRVIYDGDSKVETVKIKNPAETPFLAQSWLTDMTGQEVQDKFIVVPPVLRIESKDYAILRIKSLPTVSQLPQDRETAYFLHVREVPPSVEHKGRSTNTKIASGSIQIAIESVIKFFYRPENLKKINRIDKLIDSSTKIRRLNGNKVIIENGSPFYVTLSDLKLTDAEKSSKFKPFMLAPFSSKALNIEKSDRYTLSHINDYGATVSNTFVCNTQNVCTVQNKQ